nr:hypothetical protein [Halorarius litoreus]
MGDELLFEAIDVDSVAIESPTDLRAVAAADVVVDECLVGRLDFPVQWLLAGVWECRLEDGEIEPLGEFTEALGLAVGTESSTLQLFSHAVEGVALDGLPGLIRGLAPSEFSASGSVVQRTVTSVLLGHRTPSSVENADRPGERQQAYGFFG